MLGYKLIPEKEYRKLLVDSHNLFRHERQLAKIMLSVEKSKKSSEEFRNRMFELNEMLDKNEITYEEYRKLWSENKRKHEV